MAKFDGDNKANRHGSRKFKNPKWELFCLLYSGISSKKYFGNATQCHLFVFGGQARIDEIEEEIAELKKINPKERDYGAISDLELEQKRTYNLSNTEGTNLLVKPSVRVRVDWLTDKYLNPELMDREMAYTIGQRENLMAKVAAYTALAKVKNRINPDALEGHFTFGWEGEAGEKRPTIKKVTVKTRQEEGPEVNFEEEEKD